MNPSGSFNGIADWLHWLETLSPHEIDLGLDRIKVVLKRLALAPPLRVITVAGTNGKGSSVAMLEAILIANGESVGSYTSPHLHRFNERIRIDGKAASDQDIVAAFEAIEAHRDGVPLTYFEFGTLAALVLFDRVRPGTVILEVGLGGRLDAVNAVDPDACLITNVTLDHCDWLGNDIESIATEKAGVMRSQTPVVFGSTTVPEAITAESDRSCANLILLERDFRFVTRADDLWNWSGASVELDGLERPSLTGEQQIQNAAGVLAVIESLGLSALLDTGLVNTALSSLDLPGRMQRFEQSGKNFLIDVAHNVDSARVLSEEIRGIEEIDRVFIVIGVLAGKDVAGIVTALQAAANRWIACTPDSANPVPAEQLAREIAQRSGNPCLISGSVEIAVREVLERAGGNDLIVITGSFQTVAPAIRCLDDLRCAS